MSRCTMCNHPGEPYEYRGRQFDGLTPAYGQRLCRPCLDTIDPLDVDVKLTNPANGDTDVRNLRDLAQYAPGGTRFGSSGETSKRKPKRRANR